MNDKDKSYFIKLILASVALVAFLMVLGLTAEVVENKKVVNPPVQVSATPESTVAPEIKDEVENWKTYSKSEASFTFKYPKDWEITKDYFYETAAGIKATVPTIILQKIGNSDSNSVISINQRQFPCDQGSCETVAGNEIETYSRNKEILNIFNEIVKSFEKKDETINWQICKNKKYAYEVRYPLTWKVWLPGAPEARIANCDENLFLIAFSPNIYAYPNQQQINIDVYDQDRLKGTMWKGITSLDDYLKITPVKIKKETVVDGERLIWRDTVDNELITFHDGSITSVALEKT